MDPEREVEILHLPAETTSSTSTALDELEHVYAYIYRRVGNRADAEDLTQEVALKAIPRLRPDAGAASIRGYLFATARTELARFWTSRFGLPEDPLDDDVTADPRELESLLDQTAATRLVSRVLDELPPNYARLLELRFLRGYSTAEIAKELMTTVGGVRIMQLRALRTAGRVKLDD